MYREDIIVVKVVEQKSDFLDKPAYTTLAEHSMPPQFVPQVGDFLMHNGDMYCAIQRVWYEMYPASRLKIYVRKTS